MLLIASRLKHCTCRRLEWGVALTPSLRATPRPVRGRGGVSTILVPLAHALEGGWG